MRNPQDCSYSIKPLRLHIKKTEVWFRQFKEFWDAIARHLKLWLQVPIFNNRIEKSLRIRELERNVSKKGLSNLGINSILRYLCLQPEFGNYFCWVGSVNGVEEKTSLGVLLLKQPISFPVAVTCVNHMITGVEGLKQSRNGSKSGWKSEGWEPKKYET